MDLLRLAQDIPPFSHESPRFDMNTFTGRMLHFYSVNDPRTLLFTDEEAKAAERLLKLHKVGEAPEGTTDADLWHARRVLESALHPDTGEPIFPLFRFSAFVPVNMVIVTATITPAVISSFPATAFIHFLNQTYNAAINYANRNASNPVPTARLAEGYAGAVVTSLSIGMLSTALTRRAAARAGGGGAAAAVIRSTLPFLASSLAGASNVLLMRRNELTTGVDVFDDDGRDLGKSVEAGKVGLMKCAAARIIWNVPVMMFPPIIMSRLEKLRLISSSPRLRMACETAVVTTCLLGAVSPALAFFPQRDSLAVDTLEPKFSGLNGAVKSWALRPFASRPAASMSAGSDSPRTCLEPLEQSEWVKEVASVAHSQDMYRMNGLHPHQQPPGSLQAVRLVLGSVLSSDIPLADHVVRVRKRRAAETHSTTFA